MKNDVALQTHEVAHHFDKRPVALRQIQTTASDYGDGTEQVWQKAAVSHPPWHGILWLHDVLRI